MKKLVGSVTQGSADAFAEAEIQTGLANVSNSAFRIRRIEWYMPALASADSEIMMSIAGRTLSAINLVAVSVLAGLWKKVELTTSGSPVYELFPNAERYDRDEDLVIVEESIFLQIDSTGTGASNSGSVVVWYEPRSITQTERLTIQAARLA